MYTIIVSIVFSCLDDYIDTQKETINREKSSAKGRMPSQWPFLQTGMMMTGVSYSRSALPVRQASMPAASVGNILVCSSHSVTWREGHVPMMTDILGLYNEDIVKIKQHIWTQALDIRFVFENVIVKTYLPVYQKGTYLRNVVILIMLMNENDRDYLPYTMVT